MTDTRTKSAFLLHIELRKTEKERRKQWRYALIFLKTALTEENTRNQGNCFGRLLYLLSLGGHCVLVEIPRLLFAGRSSCAEPISCFASSAIKFRIPTSTEFYDAIKPLIRLSPS